MTRLHLIPFLPKVVDLINTAQLEEKDNKLECLRKVHHRHCAVPVVPATAHSSELLVTNCIRILCARCVCCCKATMNMYTACVYVTAYADGASTQLHTYSSLNVVTKVSPCVCRVTLRVPCDHVCVVYIPCEP